MSDTNSAIQFFVKLFERGNATRGWSEGNPYVSPGSKHESKFVVNEFRAYMNLSEYIASLDSTLKTELFSLPLFIYNNMSKSFERVNCSIGKSLDLLQLGKCSPVVASSYFMSTAIYYLQEKYDYSLPGVNIEDLVYYRVKPISNT